MIPDAARRRLIASLAAPLLVGTPPARSQNEAAPFTPKPGQFGKDVVWLPTPDAVVRRMLHMAQLRAGETLVDLGSGDGKIVIAAAREFGACARGIEYDPRLVELARHNAQVAGVAARARFEEGDLFAADVGDAAVITLYLLPLINLRLRPALLRLQPGTRIVAHQFAMGQWEPDETSVLAHRTAFLWWVPANAGGTWALDLPQRDATTVSVQLTMTQTFQRIQGVATLGELQTTLRAPQLSGRQLRFALTDAAGELRHVEATITDQHLHGTVTSAALGVQPLRAQRLGAAPEISGSGPATQAEEHAAGALLGDY